MWASFLKQWRCGKRCCACILSRLACYAKRALKSIFPRCRKPLCPAQYHPPPCPGRAINDASRRIRPQYTDARDCCHGARSDTALATESCVHSSHHGIAARLQVGIKLPAHTHVVVLLQALHTHPDYWKEPQKFDPQRRVADFVRSQVLPSLATVALELAGC